MIVKFLHLNIYLGNFIDKVVNFVKNNDIDILNFQEVTGGKLSFGNIDCFEYIKNALSYRGEISVSWGAKGEPNSYFGNATFYKKDFRLNRKSTIHLSPYSEIKDPEKRDIKDDPRSLLSLNLNINNKSLEIVNTHLAWGPTPKDEPYKLNQGKILYDYLKSIKDPFILSGDFNLDSTSRVIKSIETLGRNLTAENNVQNTLNPRTHHVKRIFPKGIAVDYIFADKSIKVNKFEVIDKIDLSDHFGLLMEFDV